MLVAIACVPLVGRGQVEVIATIANKDTSAGYGGDNGPAVNAKLWFPDSGDSGLATNAQLSRPTGLFVDKQYNLFITEFGNGVVRRVDAITGIITTVAGNRTWGYSGDGRPPLGAQMVPGDAIFSDNGDMIVADYDNQCIRRGRG